jgi:toxin ParE1/3/4
MAAYALTREARSDLVRIARRSAAQWGLRQRNRYMAELIGHIELIASRPHMGRVRDEVGTGVRGTLHGPYVVFYRLVRSRVEVLRIIHMSRDITRAIANE